MLSRSDGAEEELGMPATKPFVQALSINLQRDAAVQPKKISPVPHTAAYEQHGGFL